MSITVLQQSYRLYTCTNYTYIAYTDYIKHSYGKLQRQKCTYITLRTITQNKIKTVILHVIRTNKENALTFKRKIS